MHGLAHPDRLTIPSLLRGDVAAQEMGELAFEATLMGPFVVIIGLPCQQATHAASVLSSFSTSGRIFFFCTWLGAHDSPVNPSMNTFSPITASAGGSSSSILPSAGTHAMTIPWDSKPAILAAFRFVTTTTFRPGQKLSSVKCARRPEAIWRGLSSPTSISSQKSFSESGWCHVCQRTSQTMSRQIDSANKCDQTGLIALADGSRNMGRHSLD